MMFSCSVVSDCDPMGFPRQKFWSELPSPSPGNLDLGIKPGHPALAGRFFTPLSIKGFPGGTCGKESACQCKRCKRLGFNLWVRKIPWRRVQQPAPV